MIHAQFDPPARQLLAAAIPGRFGVRIGEEHRDLLLPAVGVRQ